jgi:hypothetical protein
MSRRWQAAVAAAWMGVASVLLVAPAAAAPELTDTETAWLDAAVPVLRFAQQQGLPLDIIVQPQAAPGETPMGLAFVDGRCKLVLSMRGNPQAQATLDRIEPGLRGPVVEAIAAHELGHCWRHVSGVWGTLPAGMNELTVFARLAPEHASLLKDMWRTRREEGFADLVGLAWTLRHNPRRYAEVQAWHEQLRAEQAVETGPHDTRVWVHLARDRTRFASSGSIFEQVRALWVEGLLAGVLNAGAATTLAQGPAFRGQGERALHGMQD